MLPSANVLDPYWIRYDGATYLNKGQSPMNFMLEDMESNVKSGDAYWISLMGSDNSTWPFNTKCCATRTYARMANCDRRSIDAIV